MKRQIFSLIVLFICVALCINIKANNVAESDTVVLDGVIYTLEKNEYIVTGYTKVDENLVIKDSIGEYSVTTICDYAFNKCNSIVSLIIPTGIKDIGEEAFYKCDNLKNVTINQGVITIGEYAFADCVKLNKVFLPESIIEMGENVFYNCKSDMLITGVSNTYIEKYALNNGIDFNIYTPSRVENIKIGLTSKSNVKISWKNSRNATYYEVYRSSKKTKGYKKIASTVKRAYTDKAIKVGKKYYYKIKAVAHKEDITRYSKMSKVKGVTIKPTKVKLIKSEDDSYVYIRFDKSKRCGKYFDMYISIDGKKYEKNNITEQKIKKGFKIKKSNLQTGISYNIKIRTYVKNGSKKIYSKYSNVVQCKK